MTMKTALSACTAALALTLTGCGDSQKSAQNGAVANSQEAENGFAKLEDTQGLSTAARLLKSAELDRLLKGRGSYTIFAPSDEAFAALPDDQRKALEQEDGRPQLIALLRQHMTPGYLTAQDIAKAVDAAKGKTELASLGAAPIALRKQGNTILIGTSDGAAHIVGEPVALGNSIAYRIDRILPPPAG
jgi:uncharacterized surface protein with fasciclin (FAS1) repeats